MTGEATPTPDAVAIVGMACRFPGAPDLAAFWRNLEQGVESVTFYTDEELAAAGVDPGLIADPRYVKSGGGVLENIDQFDAGLAACAATRTRKQYLVPLSKFFFLHRGNMTFALSHWIW